MTAVRVYVATVCGLALAAVGGVWAAGGTDGPERWWLVAAVAGLIALEHVFAMTRVAYSREQRESQTHEESFLVVLAMVVSPLAVVAAFGGGFLAGNLIDRRPAIKGVFNLAVMVGPAAAGLLLFEALADSSDGTARVALAALAAAASFVVLNRVTVAGVLTLTKSGTLRSNLLDDVRGRVLVASGDIAIGLLSGVAATRDLWTLPFGLAALAVLHFSLTGHGRARAERQKLADVVNSSSDGIFTVDENETVISWNPTCERITGYPAARVVGLRRAEVAELLAASRPAASNAVDDLYPPQHDEPVVSTIRAADGSVRWIASTRADLPEGGAVVVFRDETIRRQIDELLAEQKTERLRADFVATVSHELRTPLTSILGFARTLRARGESDEAQRERYLQIIESEGERLGALIDDLLDLRQVGEGELDLAPEPLDLAALVRDESALFAERSKGHWITIDLPPERIDVRADRRRLRQVLANLLSNAIKYSPGGGEVRVGAAVTDGRVRVSIRDTGLGIPVDQQPNVFEKFFRVRSQRHREVGGTGLGLALAREIVEAHGGRIGFESQENRGSTFYFDLPVSDSVSETARR